MSSDTVYLQWLKDWTLYPRPHDLPDSPNTNGRPVWEPPILDYTQLIGDDYQKKRDAVMKFLNHDVVQTTTIMDLYTEEHLLFDYLTWAKNSASGVGNEECRRFFQGLVEVLREDWFEVEDEWIEAGGIGFMMRGDGTYKVTTFSDPGVVDSETDEDASARGDGSETGLAMPSTKDVPGKAVVGRPESVYSRTTYTTSLKAIQVELASLASLGIPATASPLATLPSYLARQIVDPSLALRLVSLHRSSRHAKTEHLLVDHGIDDID